MKDSSAAARTLTGLTNHSRRSPTPSPPAQPRPAGRHARLRRPASPTGWGRAVWLVAALLLLSWNNPACAQGTLTNGWTHTGTIAPGGETDAWTFAASIGDRIVIRVGEITQTNNFTPRLRLMNPVGTLQASSSGAAAAEISPAATNTGTFTVMVDGVAATATGTYRLTLAKTPGEIAVAPGDEGGPLTNGLMHTGTIDLGDLDVWMFSANAGENLTLRMGELNFAHRTSSARTQSSAAWADSPALSLPC